MLEVIQFLDHWQTLVGSILGGLLGLLAALVVAHQVERRQDLSAAMVAVAALVPVRGGAESLRKLARERQIPEGEPQILFFAEKLAWLKPNQPSAIEASIARLMPIDNVMAAHLTFFRSFYFEFESRIERIRDTYSRIKNGADIEKERPNLLAEASIAVRSFFSAAEHVEYAEYLVGRYVLGSTPTLKRLLSRVYSNSTTKAAREYLKQ